MLDDIRRGKEPVDFLKWLGQQLVVVLVMAVAVGISLLFWWKG